MQDKTKRQLYELHAGMCRVFTSPKRLEILNCLRQGEKSVSQLVKQLGIPQANLSQHLAILREKGIVQTRRAGVTIYYSLTNPKIIRAFDIIREILLKKLARADTLFKKLR